MREIKFRAWDKVDGVIWEWPAVMQFGFKILTDPAYIVMQYIGRKDKNGRDIYEDDIVQWPVFDPDPAIREAIDRPTGVVEWDEGSVGFVVVNAGMVNISFDWVEIIGNRYENPELTPA